MDRIDGFLARIGMEGEEVGKDLAFLSRLQEQFVLTVPYENLDILCGKPLSLSKEDIYEKIVKDCRGGYCFELNGAIAHLLQELGFATKCYFARFLKGESEIPVRRHRVVVTECEGNRYVIEVGIGIEAPREPLLLEEGIEQECSNGSFCFAKDAFLGWVLNEKIDGEWQPYYAFTEEEQLDIDFIQPSFYCEKHPASPFNKSPMVAIKTPNGRRAINDHDYKVFENGELVHIEENITDARLYEILKTDFGIEWRYQK
jgi:N-hydroxyarylamine O-acetyltransferase